ncbi:8558_t:CDS:1 [Ambispora leptoticha]|uniref:8558_t:CDS:1 n=1 Tax=Ambispora leptoticha TaxID=144679 RepID=A0A9N9G827_9GLOM|nr:8558_t:CDS:1 [Ambispora leptoticha]
MPQTKKSRQIVRFQKHISSTPLITSSSFVASRRPLPSNTRTPPFSINFSKKHPITNNNINGGKSKVAKYIKRRNSSLLEELDAIMNDFFPQLLASVNEKKTNGILKGNNDNSNLKECDNAPAIQITTTENSQKVEKTDGSALNKELEFTVQVLSNLDVKE